MGMVVRSNIMALNANRQLGMNNSAVSKSLEKLSSGFKINRAGDDASGLAISEKMKAQIKGLETASANSQDGISLVQTAEGALTEVHDMLNRMVELAEKAANGTMETVDSEVNGGTYGKAGTDRNAIQDEMDALATEIDRIADSTNFNNIKLLDGSLSKTAAATGGAGPTGGGAINANYGVMMLADAPRAVAAGSPTVHYATGNAGTPVSGSGTAAVLTVDLTGITTGTGANTGTVVLTIGDKTFNVTNVASGATAGVLASAAAAAIGSGAVTINGKSFMVTASGTKLILTAQDKGQVSAPAFGASFGTMGVTGSVPTVATISTAGANITMSGATPGSTTFAFSSALSPSDGEIMTIGGQKFQFVASGSSLSVASGAISIALPADGSFAVLVSNISAAFSGASISGASSISISTGGVVTVASSSATPVQVTFGVDSASSVTYAPPALGTGTVKAGTKIEMDFTNAISASGANFGSGAIMNINGKYYEFVPGTGIAAASAGDSASDTIKVRLGATAEDSLKNLAKAITDSDPALEASYSGGKMVLNTKQDLAGAPAWEMTNAGTGGTITASDFQSPYTNAEVTQASKGGLVLQIGDTNDSFNKLTVSIEDMHMESLFANTGVTGLVTQTTADGVVTLDVSNQENAGHALTAIKKAINSVSTQRAKLGAVQNRLEHTINNLDVAAENMSAANSRIRDTDMAKQMMDYTKMNVLTQAAQAMLAQANQQPQSVLQLLQ